MPFPFRTIEDDGADEALPPPIDWLKSAEAEFEKNLETAGPEEERWYSDPRSDVHSQPRQVALHSLDQQPYQTPNGVVVPVPFGRDFDEEELPETLTPGVPEADDPLNPELNDLARRAGPRLASSDLRFVPVDYDPFTVQQNHKLVPVEHDPFAPDARRFSQVWNDRVGFLAPGKHYEHPMDPPVAIDRSGPPKTEEQDQVALGSHLRQLGAMVRGETLYDPEIALRAILGASEPAAIIRMIRQLLGKGLPELPVYNPGSDLRA